MGSYGSALLDGVLWLPLSKLPLCARHGLLTWFSEMLHKHPLHVPILQMGKLRPREGILAPSCWVAEWGPAPEQADRGHTNLLLLTLGQEEAFVTFLL